METEIRDRIEGIQKVALAVGAGALALCIAGGFVNKVQFFRSYLFGFIFWLGIPLGSMALLMLHHLVGGYWGHPIRRMLEASSRTMVLVAAMAVPLLFGLRSLYSWADPAQMAASELLQHKSFYLNVPFFVVRTVVFFAAWILLAHLLAKWSFEQDRSAQPGVSTRLQSLSAPGVAIYALTVTFASIDWVMSLEPSWSSTIYGMIFIVTQLLATMSLAVIACLLLRDAKPISTWLTPTALNDQGNFLLTFTMLWAYLSFSQFLIIWSGNLPEEITWYVARAQGSWAWIAVALIVFHFAVPFLLLLSRFVKRRIRWLAWVALLLVAMSILDLFWLMTPAYNRLGPSFQWMDWLAISGLGGIWIWRFFGQLKQNPLMAVNDPRLAGGPGHHA
jgi:hypothetical protein